MAFTPKTILVSPDDALADELTFSFAPELLLTGIDIAPSTHAALQYFMELAVDLCVISETIKPTDVKALVDDVRRLALHKECVFIVVHHKTPVPVVTAPYTTVGAAAVVSSKGNESDKNAVTTALAAKLAAWELQRSLQDCSTALGVILREIERLALERKRGRELTYNSSFGDVVQQLTEQDARIAEHYWNELIERADDAEPFTATSIEVPADVLNRKLPKLSRERYHGASSRVWGRLLNKFGVKEGPKSAPAPEASQPGEDPASE